MEKTTIYLPADPHNRLKRRAAECGRTQATLIREALDAYLDGREHPLPRSIGIYKGPPRDDGINASNIKGWARENWIKELRYGRA
ncbi:MAG: CopG family transcriptional regulator [Dehalococcoidia bacterium]